MVRDKDPRAATVHFGPEVPKGDRVESGTEGGSKTKARELFDALSEDDQSVVEAYFGADNFDRMTDDEDAGWNADERESVYGNLKAIALETDEKKKIWLAQQLNNI